MTNEGEKQDWFTRWGRHYLRSLCDAYSNEICNNFKDKGVSNFGGKLFNTLRDKTSDIFDDMPPPKQTVTDTTYGSSGMRGGFQFPGARGGFQSPRTLAPVATMASYNTQYSGGCCARGSHILLKNGSIKKVEDIKYGDEVVTIDIKDRKFIESSSKIECVVNTKCYDNKEFMVELEGGSGNKLKITPYHPVFSSTFLHNKWVFPFDISSSRPKEIDCKDMFTFVTKNRKPVVIEDYIFATYGHHLKGDVIEHDYFGTEKVIYDLKQFDTYQFGYVHLKKNMFVKNNGKVTNIISDYYPNFKTNIVELMMYANL